MKRIIFILFTSISLSFLSSAQDTPPALWFQHDDFVDMNDDDTLEFVPDMLTRWYNHTQWYEALDNTDVYSIHENLFKIGGAPLGMGEQFLLLLENHFGTMEPESLHVAYLKLILPVLHAHNVELQVHTVGSRGDFVPWDMHGTNGDGMDTVFYQNDKGLKLVKETLSLINGVCNELFTDGYKVSSIKLQSVLSGIWERGLQNNIYCALEYMKAVQSEYPDIKFYLGDALLQKRDYDENFDWREAYQLLYDTILNNSIYNYLNFKGFRIEFNKYWADPTKFENAAGWDTLAGDSGAVKFIHNLNWEAGIEFNNPYANNEWYYEKLVLRTAQKSLELNLNFDFVVLHTDEAGGDGYAYPYDVAPENRAPDEPPTFSSVLNNVFNFYQGTVSVEKLDLGVKDFLLSQNYPNPFNPSTVISYQLPELSQVTLKVYDILGREVASLVNQKQAAGNYEIEFSGKGLSSGIYFYQLKSDNFLDVKKMILLK